MSAQGLAIAYFVLGAIVAGAGCYGAPNRWGYWLVALVAAALFLLMLVGAVRL